MSVRGGKSDALALAAFFAFFAFFAAFAALYSRAISRDSLLGGDSDAET